MYPVSTPPFDCCSLKFKNSEKIIKFCLNLSAKKISYNNFSIKVASEQKDCKQGIAFAIKFSSLFSWGKLLQTIILRLKKNSLPLNRSAIKKLDLP